MGISKQYNSVRVKDNCTLCLPTLLFSRLGNLTVLFKFTPYRPLLPKQPFRSCKVLHYSQWRFQSGITQSP